MPEISASKSSHWHRPDRQKRCISCGETKGLSEFYAYEYTTSQGKRSTRYESRCRPCAVQRRRAQYQDNPEKCRQSSNAWKAKNKDRIRQHIKEKRKDPEFKRQKAKLQRERKARMKSGGSGNGDPRIAALYDEATQLQAKLRACVVCDDPLELQIHVDHQIPLSKGGRHVFENLQILSGRENIDKGVKPHSAWRGVPHA